MEFMHCSELETKDVQGQGPSNKSYSVCFASLMFTGLHNHFPLLTIPGCNTNIEMFRRVDEWKWIAVSELDANASRI